MITCPFCGGATYPIYAENRSDLEYFLCSQCGSHADRNLIEKARQQDAQRQGVRYAEWIAVQAPAGYPTVASVHIACPDGGSFIPIHGAGDAAFYLREFPDIAERGMLFHRSLFPLCTCTLRLADGAMVGRIERLARRSWYGKSQQLTVLMPAPSPADAEAAQ